MFAKIIATAMRHFNVDYTIDTTDLSEYIGSVIRPEEGIILYCEKGRAVVTVNFERRFLQRGDIVIIFPDVLFTVISIGREFLAWQIDMSASFVDDTTYALSDTFLNRIYDDPIFRTNSEQQELFAKWRNLNDYYLRISSPKSAQMMLRSQVQNLFTAIESETLSALSGIITKKTGSVRMLLTNFYRLLGEHYRSQHNVKFYADKLCITPYYLSKITFKMLKLSPKEIIDRQIVMEIKHLLSTTDLSSKEIADMFNFDSTSYMGRYFRRHTGVTPSEFRKQ